MQLYAYECVEHGEFEEFRSMSERNSARCPECGKPSRRVYYPLSLQGDLPTKDRRIGKTRKELFDNLAAEGFASKDWMESDGLAMEECMGGSNG